MSILGNTCIWKHLLLVDVDVSILGNCELNCFRYFMSQRMEIIDLIK